MKAKSLATLIMLTAALTNCANVFADSNSSASASSGTQSSSTKGSSAKGSPAMVAGVILGSIVGTPVCFVRRLKHDEVQGTQGITGDSENKLLLVPAGAFWLTFALATSIMEAPVYAFRNSWMAEKPFSKEQFSLGVMPDY